LHIISDAVLQITDCRGNQEMFNMDCWFVSIPYESDGDYLSLIIYVRSGNSIPVITGLLIGFGQLNIICIYIYNIVVDFVFEMIRAVISAYGGAVGVIGDPVPIRKVVSHVRYAIAVKVPAQIDIVVIGKVKFSVSTYGDIHCSAAESGCSRGIIGHGIPVVEATETGDRVGAIIDISQ